MGIRLDWEIEADQKNIHTATEDPSNKSKRRQSRVRLIALLCVLALIGGGIIALISWRLGEVDQRIEQNLRATVEAEIAAIRFGNWDAFYAIQRSADVTWTEIRQRDIFNDYQQLKLNPDFDLTGTIRDLLIDGSRGRVLVEEIIDGVPYVQVWFYWRYEDGWRHVPPDYTFLGDPEQYNGTTVTVRYAALEEPFAREIGVSVENWVNSTCAAILDCGDFPHITLNVIADDSLTEPQWGTDNRWRLDLPSPYLGRVRYDQPFSAQLKIDIADRIATRLLEASSAEIQPPEFFRDVVFLHDSVKKWLIGRFIGINQETHLITSLAENYTSAAVGQLMQRLDTTATIATFAEVTGVTSLHEANLDWRDYLTWRLRLESELLTASPETLYLALYDPQLESLARQRYGQPFDPNVMLSDAVVTLATLSTNANGTPQLEATVHYTDETGTPKEGRVRFHLINNQWLRAS